MGKVTAYLRALIEKQAKDHGVVVWYDPEEVYTALARSTESVGEAALLRYEGSFLELRERLEPYLEFVGEDGRLGVTPPPDPLPEAERGSKTTPPPDPLSEAERGSKQLPPSPLRGGGQGGGVVVYVPLERRATRYALVEAESLGVVMEPGSHSLPRNTRLRVLAERVFQEVAPERAAEYGRQAEQGMLTLADLDELAEQSAGTGAGAVWLIFQTTAAAEIALAFVAAERHDADLEARRAVPELAAVLRAELGLAADANAGVKALRRAARLAVLLADFRAGLPAGQRVPSLEALPLPPSPAHVVAARRLCHTWRTRPEHREAYAEAARALEQELRLATLDVPAEALARLETFPWIEARLLARAEGQLLAGDPQAALDLAERRRQSFWTAEAAAPRLHWALLETAARLLLAARAVQADVKAVRRDIAGLVQAYAAGEAPWCRLDTVYRHLERQYATFDLELSGAHDPLERVVHAARQAYAEVVDQCAEAGTAALEAADFAAPGVPRQRDVFGKHVAPALGERGKQAYLLVDGLRYEMARELLDGLGDGVEARLTPALAQLPSVTEVGMAALLPGAERDLELAEAGGEVVVRLGGRPLKDRAARVRLLREALGEGLAELKLNDLIKPTRKVQEAVQSAALVLVTSQEIDRRGEESADEDEARRYMDEVLVKLRKGIRRLAALGVARCVLTADHGHLFVEGLSSGMKIDPPGGRTLELHRRAWVGVGGRAAAGYLRVAAERLGLAGGLELAFPRGLARFKVRGGSESYFHGGPSLQELVIPVAVLEFRAAPAPGGAGKVELKMERPRVTTRFFSVTATYRPEGLFAAEEKRVVLTVRAGRKEVGTAAMAAYGFEEGTQEVVLEKERPNAVTLMLTAEGDVPSVSVHALDSATQVELARLENIPVTISL